LLTSSDQLARLLFLILGFEKPSSKKRILCSVEHLESKGHLVDVREIPGGMVGRLKILNSLRHYDLIVLQKKLFGFLQFSLMRRANSNIIFDLDDAVMFHEVERGEPLSGKFFGRFSHTASGSAGVIAGNSYLAEFARAARFKKGTTDEGVIVLPTPVDTDMAAVKDYNKETERVVVGWIGTKGNLAHLKSITKPLEKFFQSCPGARLIVVSDAAPDISGIPMEFNRWSADREQDDLHSFDIGIMPLIDNMWTRGKGGFKLLQYMAAGLSAIASPVGINRDIIRHGESGFLAGSEQEWVDSLLTLARDRERREQMGRRGREIVEREYSLKEYNRRLAEFIERFV
jgi:hypothetical protein